MDLAQITEGLTRVTIAGKPYDLRLLKLREWGRIQGWLKQAVPSPVAEALRSLEQLRAAGDKVDPATRQALLDHAHEAARVWPPRVGTIPWIQALSETEGGTARFLREALAAAGHTLTDDEAAELDAIASVDEVADVIRVCLHGELPLPKAETAPKESEPAPQA